MKTRCPQTAQFSTSRKETNIMTNILKIAFSTVLTALVLSLGGASVKADHHEAKGTTTPEAKADKAAKKTEKAADKAADKVEASADKAAEVTDEAAAKAERKAKRAAAKAERKAKKASDEAAAE